MSEVSVIGLDVVKHVFQVRRLEEAGRAVMRKQLRHARVLKLFRR